MAILVTGGCGFIGTNFIVDWLSGSGEPLLNLDILTYAGNRNSLSSFANDDRYSFAQTSIGDTAAVSKLLFQHNIRAIVNFAAESHVDRSIANPEVFFETNVSATQRLLEATRLHHARLTGTAQQAFRFVHISTDEVYGSLATNALPFTEESPVRPSSPYAASKAGSDHLVRSYNVTYGVPTLTINCSNNYGACQFPEKFIPVLIANALAGKPLPIYGDGRQIRDWVYVNDHCRAIRTVLASGEPGATYNVGGNSERTNLEVATTICGILDELRPRRNGSYADQISFVTDRLGHDRRYAVDFSKIRAELGWSPLESFETGIVKTVRWYLENPEWLNDAQQRHAARVDERRYA